MGSKGNAGFFANFYILLNFMSLLLQLFATPKIQDKVGLRGGLILLWLKQAASKGKLPMPLDTSWMVWFTLATVAIWLVITQKLRTQVKKEVGEAKVTQVQDVECERFPDQCPCTTELGKGIA
jgi:hypothetical protein